jgi:hypothetical protein
MCEFDFLCGISQWQSYGFFEKWARPVPGVPAIPVVIYPGNGEFESFVKTKSETRYH